MNEPTTVRERIQHASQYFKQIHGVVLTTFNLNGEFLETNALPSVFNIEGSGAGRRAELHNQLSQTPCTVFYDPTTDPKISGRYRYVAQPVPLPGRFFHPKLVIIAGESDKPKKNTAWVYLAVTSANLSLSGWGRNAESFGETWIHTRKQQPWQALHGLFDWLDSYCELSESHGGVAKIRNTLIRMPNIRRHNYDETQPWAQGLSARFYVSSLSTQGLPVFLRNGWTRKLDDLWVYSPYWSNVSEHVDSFNAKCTSLFPALRSDGKSVGLSTAQYDDLNDSTDVCRNKCDNGDRFWHMKAYWLSYGKQTRIAVGSCNFTSAGLVGGEVGNVETMLVFDDKDDDWLPDAEELPNTKLACEEEMEEGTPETVPVAIVVVWDWEQQLWRWWLKPTKGQSEFELQLPGIDPFAIEPGRGNKSGKQPPPGAKFTVFFTTGENSKNWQGQVVELNLVHSPRSYGKPLSATEILESWRTESPHGGDRKGPPNESDEDDGDELEQAPPAAFDAVNLYDLYCSTKALRNRLKQQADRSIQRSLLVGRADSAMSLAYLADQDEEAPVVRYLVLREICSIVSEWSSLFEGQEIGVVESAKKIANRAREQVRQALKKELPKNLQSSTDRMLQWFERQLSEMDTTNRA